ncbi:unnamed protein product, partial [Didymodactylos carnosus]
DLIPDLVYRNFVLEKSASIRETATTSFATGPRSSFRRQQGPPNAAARFTSNRSSTITNENLSPLILPRSPSSLSLQAAGSLYEYKPKFAQYKNANTGAIVINQRDNAHNHTTLLSSGLHDNLQPVHHQKVAPALSAAVGQSTRQQQQINRSISAPNTSLTHHQQMVTLQTQTIAIVVPRILQYIPASSMNNNH